MSERAYYINPTKETHYYKFNFIEQDDSVTKMYLACKGQLKVTDFDITKEDDETLFFPSKIVEIKKDEFMKNAKWNNIAGFSLLKYNLLLDYPDNLVNDLHKNTKRHKDYER